MFDELRYEWALYTGEPRLFKTFTFSGPRIDISLRQAGKNSR